jgi:hypothetical protein
MSGPVKTPHKGPNHHQRTPKYMNDHRSTYNKQVSLLNQIYNQESSCRKSGVDDAMVLVTTKKQYKSNTGGTKFKHFHWWDAVKHQPEWRAKFVGSSSDRAVEEEVSCPMGHDRAKVMWKGKGEWKGKESSNSQSEPSSAVGGMMSTFKRLSTSFVKAQP